MGLNYSNSPKIFPTDLHFQAERQQVLSKGVKLVLRYGGKPLAEMFPGTIRLGFAVSMRYIERKPREETISGIRYDTITGAWVKTGAGIPKSLQGQV